MELVSLKNVNYSVKDSSFINSKIKHIIKDVSFNIDNKSTLALIGESGSGKTTISKIIAGFTEPSSGEIKYNTQIIKNEYQIQYLFQNSRELLNPQRKISSQLNDVFESKKYKNIQYSVSDVLSLVELEKEILDKYTFMLSGGELQRVALARLLLTSPNLLILDEPFSAQDIISQKMLKELLINLKENLDMNLLIVSHNIQILKGLADDIVVLKNGIIQEKLNANVLFTRHGKNYSDLLLEAEKFQLDKSQLSTLE